MDARHIDADRLRADFYLSLARAFITPEDGSFFIALRDDLPLDLAELADALAYPIQAEIEEFRRRMLRLDGPEALMRLYSRLFLQPPRAAHLNVGIYLDGCLNGGSVVEMEAWYHRCGLSRAEDFHDLSDHVAIQLECIAWLYSQRAAQENVSFTAGQFLHRFVLAWAPAWCDDIAQAELELNLPDEPFLPLTRILHTAAIQDAEALPQDPAQARRDKALAKARLNWAKKGSNADDLAKIRRCLLDRGLAVDHLEIDYSERDAARGWYRMTPPVPRK